MKMLHSNIERLRKLIGYDKEINSDTIVSMVFGLIVDIDRKNGIQSWNSFQVSINGRVITVSPIIIDTEDGDYFKNDF